MNRIIKINIDRMKGVNDPQYCFDNITKCDICNREFSCSNLLIDGKLSIDGRRDFWAYMCADCFLIYGVGLVYGKGQVYEKTLNNKWLLIGGFPIKDD